ncbi:ABC transporter permease [Massilia atriviolacea]|uniref:ABC transporter permease n=2 Tax=Massilia atriviolacea TaxID=2495579 RepID=A0A430HN23_9BURK|nr:ABC transporter permease [Massilia atriviolacea]
MRPLMMAPLPAPARPGWLAWTRGHAARLTGACGIVAVLCAWELLVGLGGVDPTYLPPPSAVAAVLPGLFLDGPLMADVRASLSAVLSGTLIACLIALPATVAAHLCAPLRWLSAPIVELVRGIAPLALLPAFLLVFGLGTRSTVAIIVWVAWPPLFINVLAGLDATDRRLIEAARSMGATTGWLLLTVYMPSVAGHFLAGLRLALGSAWLAVVAAEMLGANAGIGFRILEWSQTFHITAMYGAIVVIGVISLGLNGVLAWASAMSTRGQAP